MTKENPPRRLTLDAVVTYSITYALCGLVMAAFLGTFEGVVGRGDDPEEQIENWTAFVGMVLFWPLFALKWLCLGLYHLIVTTGTVLFT